MAAKPTPVERAEAEMDTIHDAITADLAGQPVRILPMDDWPSSGRRAFGEARYDEWAEKCLAGDDYVNVWSVVDPTLKQMGPFFKSWEKQTGQDMGESEAS